MSDKKTEDQDTHTQDAQDEGVVIKVQGSEDLSGDELTPGRILKADDLEEEKLQDDEPEEKPKEKPKPKSKPKKPKTVTVYYYGVARMGTENPRRMWRYGDSMKVSPEVAEELLKKLYFTKTRRRKKK